MLIKHFNEDEASRILKQTPTGRFFDDSGPSTLAYSSRYATGDVPKFKIPKESAEPRVAYQLIHDELKLDGQPSQNCASFVHTWMEPEAKELIMENIAKNLSDQDEYPATMELVKRCISMIGNLWNADSAIGTATVGSSEAVMLGGLAMKKRWQARQREQGKDTTRPNVIMGNNAQVALEKFARYFDVECRLVPVSKKGHFVLDIDKAMEMVDENTIGIFVILGSTYTGHFEDVGRLSQLLDEYQDKTGINIPIHVDAASAGFVAPFAFPELKWDFRLPRVVSINASGHKYGMTYAGSGWILWRDESYLPKELIFELHYLGGTEKTFNLNFSRPACFAIAQYYNFLRLGMDGYTKIIENDLTNARLLSVALEATDYFDMVSDVHRPEGIFGWEHRSSFEDIKKRANKKERTKYNPSLPVVSFKLTDEFKKKHPHVKQNAISTLLRTRGWIIPNYPLPPDEEETEILRIVVRESISRDMIDKLVEEIVEMTERLKNVEHAIDARICGSEEDNKKDKNMENNEHLSPSTYARPC